MRLCAAIAIAETQHVLELPRLFQSLEPHGFDEMLLLWTSEEKRPVVQGDVRVVRAHPDFLVEAALHESSADWVFLFFPGESLDILDEGATLRAALSGAPEKTWAALVTVPMGEIEQPHTLRGFRNHVVTNGGLLDISGVALRGRPVVSEYAAPPESSPTPLPVVPLTVVLPIWRLGGLDLTLKHLEAQTCQEFELVIVDALHRWRHDRIYTALEHFREKFPIQHLPVDHDVFPLSSHSRFRNTAIRRASGERLVFLCEYACPPPTFLEHHVALPKDTIGLGPWARTTINPNALECTLGMSVWDVLEKAQKGRFLWSTFRKDVNPFGEVIARFPQQPSANEELGTKEYLGHYKSDSVPTHLVRKVNGWDESFDGQGDLADTDFTLRLLWAGAKMRVLDVETPVLDAHIISVAPISDKTRSNPARLLETKVKRMMRCVHGLTRGIVND